METEEEQSIQQSETSQSFKRNKADSVENNESGWDEDFEWKNKTQHITYFLLYLCEWNTFVLLLYEDSRENPEDDVSLLHYFIMTILVGSPLIFMQTFIGQYTRRGPFVVGEMMPLAYGFGYTIASISFSDFIIQFYYTSYFLYYFLVAVNNDHGPWILCNEQFYAAFPNCFSYEDIDWCPTIVETEEPCFSPEDKILPGSIYLHYVGLDRLRGSKEIDEMYPKASSKLFFVGVHTLMIMIVMIIISGRTLRNFEVLLKFAIASIFACLLAMLVVIITQSGGIFGLQQMFSAITFPSLFNLMTWSTCFRRLVYTLKITQGGHILFGSFIPVNDLSPYRSAYLCGSFLVTIAAFYMYFYFFYGLFMYKLNLTLPEFDLDFELGIIFVFFPYLLGVQAAGRFFCTIYFFVLLLLNFCCLNIKLLVLEKMISSHFKITSHFIYIKYGLIILATVVSFILIIPAITELLPYIMHEYFVFIIFTLCLELVIVLLYGIQRFCDDIHFFLHVKVASFIKVSWIFTPFLCIGEIIIDVLFQGDYAKISGVRLVVFAFCYIPVIISICKIIFVYAKNKNLIGLLRPMDSYGPPDIIQRIFRILYNPRLTVKFKRQIELCNHECLIWSPGLQRAILEEINLIRKLAAAVEKNMNSSVYQEVSERLKLHVALLKEKDSLKNLDEIYAQLKVPLVHMNLRTESFL